MRVLIAPDKFAGTLGAVEVAEAIAEGWSRQAPGDRITTAPMSDGGPGFLDVLQEATAGELDALTVTGPLGEPVPATLLLAGDTAYVESAQACGLHLVPEQRRRPERATSYGVGELIAAAVDAGIRRIVVGLGGSGSNDAGAGMLAALGARPAERLRGGGATLAALEEVDLSRPRSRLAGIELLAASDVDNPLLGLRGATNVFGPQKGVSAERLPVLDAALERFATLADRRIADEKGAGAAGGIGYGLLLLGGTRVPGIDTIATAIGLPDRVRDADLVISGEGSFDIQSAAGKVVSGVARIAEQAVTPCVVIAGQVHLGAREMRVLGVQSAYGLVDLVGRDAALERARESLAEVAARVARTWSR